MKVIVAVCLIACLAAIADACTKKPCNTNEVFNCKGFECQPTCQDLKGEKCLKCNEVTGPVQTCECIAGYVRTINNGPCIPVEKCKTVIFP